MARRILCDECLKEISYRLKREEMLIIEWMNKNKIFNQQLAVDKEKLLATANTGLTTFKINVVLARLEVTGILDVILSGRNKKYFLTDDGIQLLVLYKKDLIAKAQATK